MKNLLLTIFLLSTFLSKAQDFDYYGPEPFGEILDNNFNKSWTPTPISSIANKEYVVVLDQATKSSVLMLNQSNISTIDLSDIQNVYGSSSTYGSMMRSIFQLVDINTHKDNEPTHDDYIALENKFRMNPMLHSYYAVNAASDNNINCTDGGTFYIADETNTGYLLLEFDGTPSSTSIKASSQWTYNSSQDAIEEEANWTDKWLQIDGSSLIWTGTQANATNFYLADATGLIELKITEGSDFNPSPITYQLNATAELPEISSMDDNDIFTSLPKDVDEVYLTQFGTETNATQAAIDVLDEIETTLTEASASLRYPKAFYLAVRESMLSQKISSTDIYGAKLDYNNTPNVYFTNAFDNNNIPHPFMVISSFAVSTRPNQLVDVNRPPGSEAGVGYAESDVTRNGKVAEFLIKIPLKDYGLIDNLLDNDLSAYGDLASDYDDKQGTTTEKSVYNYVGLASVGVAIDGVTIYPAQNNNLRFAVEDAEVTHSGIHVGGGLELHYHADGHGYNGNGINLYNLADYEGHDHPPVIGMAYDGIALFGKYEDSFSSMDGFSIALDDYGGHDHGDDFGYHYHAHTQAITAETEMGVSYNFNEHFLMVGAWKGNINDIPGFDEVKLNQLKEDDISRYAGASYEKNEEEEEVLSIDDLSDVAVLYPNPSAGFFRVETKGIDEVSIVDINGKVIALKKDNQFESIYDFQNLKRGIYFVKGVGENNTFIKKVIIE